MSYFMATTQKEIIRMSALCEAYEKQLSVLPKGSVQSKERKGRVYYYLTYRDGGKVVSAYAGNDESAINELRERIERRKGIENLLKGIKKELVLMNKVLEMGK